MCGSLREIFQVLRLPEIIFSSLTILTFSCIPQIALLNMQYLNYFFLINSASCRRPIKGAASRPIEHSDFRMEESFSKYIPKYNTSTDIKSEKPPTKKERSIPLWIKIIFFVVVLVFLFLVYQSMETNQGNPFSKYLNISSRGSAK